jgi:ketosteroid isomerase-like protein
LSENAEVVQRQFDAIALGVDAMAEFWHPEIEWRAVEGALDDIGPMRGHDAVRRYYAEWTEMVDDMHAEVAEVLLDEGERLVVRLRTEGRARGAESPVVARYFVTCTIRDGLIVSGREFANAEEALAAA